MSILTKGCKILNKLGLHTRAASKLVDVASRFSAEVLLSAGDLTANAKSIMGLMILGAGQDTQIRLTAEGDDAEAAIEAVFSLINDGFGEVGEVE